MLVRPIVYNGLYFNNNIYKILYLKLKNSIPKYLYLITSIILIYRVINILILELNNVVYYAMTKLFVHTL